MVDSAHFSPYFCRMRERFKQLQQESLARLRDRDMQSASRVGGRPQQGPTPGQWRPGGGLTTSVTPAGRGPTAKVGDLWQPWLVLSRVLSRFLMRIQFLCVLLLFLARAAW
jgi:hypothetical protein